MYKSSIILIQTKFKWSYLYDHTKLSYSKFGFLREGSCKVLQINTCISLCNHQFHHPNKLTHAIPLQSHHPFDISPGNHKSVLLWHYGLIILRFYINRIILSVMIWDWLLSLSIMPWRPNQIVALIVGSFSLLSKIPLFGAPLCIQSPFEGHLICFQFRQL